MEGRPEDIPLPAALRALPRRPGVGWVGRRDVVGGGTENDPGIDQRHWGPLHLQVSESYPRNMVDQLDYSLICV